MGLDITAYSHLELVDECEYRKDEDHEGCYDTGHVRAFSYTAFPRSFRGLAGADNVIDIGGSKFMGGYCYTPTEKTVTHAFHAGSYSGYSVYRNHLSTCFLGRGRVVENWLDEDGYWDWLDALPEGTPFYELINFADNEGCIGPIASEKLYKEHIDGRQTFVQYVAQLDGVQQRKDRFIESYDNWVTAFDLARQDGLVSFH